MSQSLKIKVRDFLLRLTNTGFLDRIVRIGAKVPNPIENQKPKPIFKYKHDIIDFT